MELWTQSSEVRFSEYVEALATVLGREDRAGPLKDYCIGLLMPGERKSVEPMAAILAPAVGVADKDVIGVLTAHGASLHSLSHQLIQWPCELGDLPLHDIHQFVTIFSVSTYAYYTSHFPCCDLEHTTRAEPPPG
jgi:hypothetical protein